jgi:glutamate-ammonia-ligase adenylyltransferase
MVQYGVLKCAHDHPELTDLTSSAELLAALATAGFIDREQCDDLSSAYLYFLKLEYRRKLLGKKPVVRRSRLERSPQRVIDIWRQVFESGEQSPQQA